MTKTLNHIFFFLHQNQNIFSSNIGKQNIFLEKNHNPSLQVKWSLPNIKQNKVLIQQGTENSVVNNIANEQIKK
jgi:hypothetical protein